MGAMIHESNRMEEPTIDPKDVEIAQLREQLTAEAAKCAQMRAALMLSKDAFISLHSAVRLKTEEAEALSACFNALSLPSSEALREHDAAKDAEIARLKGAFEQKQRIEEVSNQHFREAIAKVRHLWEGWDKPGIDGICERLIKVSQQNTELLEALKEASAAMDHMGDTLNGMDCVIEEEDSKHLGAFEKVRAAIAKATKDKS